MSKTTENVLLVPGESGWEIWTGQTTAAFTLHSATTVERASDLTDIPSGDLLLLFPVKAITAVPMRVTSDDDALFPDLASLHAERLGLRRKTRNKFNRQSAQTHFGLTQGRSRFGGNR